MPIEGLDHVQVAMPVGGEDAARGFYTGLLGLNEVPKPPSMAKRGGCWFERGAVKLHLGAEADFRAAKKAHPAFMVTDLAGMVATLEAAGVRAVLDDELIPYGITRAFTEDPFGNKVELMERMG